MHIAYPGGPISHSGDTIAFPLTSRYPPATSGIASDVAVGDDSERLAGLGRGLGFGDGDRPQTGKPQTGTHHYG